VADWGVQKIKYTPKDGKSKEKETVKRDLSVTDSQDNCSLLTLWGQLAENYSGSLKCPVVFRKIIVSEYCGEKMMKTGTDTLVWVCILSLV
jgi:hypothetical protein